MAVQSVSLKVVWKVVPSEWMTVGLMAALMAAWGLMMVASSELKMAALMVASKVVMWAFQRAELWVVLTASSWVAW